LEKKNKGGLVRMRLLRPIIATLGVLLLLSGLAGASQYPTVADLQKCARTEDLIKEVPASCHVADALKDGNLQKKLGEIPAPAALAKQPLENIIAAGLLKALEDARNALEKSAKEAEDFADVCKGDRPENAANCAALAARLDQYSKVKLVKPAADAGSLGGIAGGGKAEFAETPSGANTDIQAVAANALNSDDVLLLRFGFVDGVITLGKAPGNETGLIVTGETPAARAAGSDIGWGKIINDLTPPTGITAAKAQDLYNRIIKAETDGKMELAYTLARAYLASAPLGGTAWVERGLEEAFRRVNQCLTGGSLVLRGLPFDCSKYKALRAAVATDVYPGLVTGYTAAAETISCDLLRNVAETSLWAGARLGAARAYIAGRLVPPGIRQPCVEGKEALLRLARTARSAELRAEAAGDVVTLYPESDGPGVSRGRTITIMSKPRGLSALLCGIDDFNRACKPADLDNALKLLDDPNKDLQLAAWLAVGQAWAKSKSRAANWGQATTGKNEAYKRAGAYAYFYPRGLDLVRTYMEPVARGREVVVEKYALDGTKVQYRRGSGLEVTLLLVTAKAEADAEKCGNEGKDEHKAACIEALARLISGASVGKLIEDANGGSAARSKAAGLVLGRHALSKSTEREILDLILRWTVGAVSVKEPLTSGLVEAYGRKLAEGVK
jgi:hypothetical protein